MDEQRKRAILDEARANLEYLAGIEQRAAIEREPQPEPEPWSMRARHDPQPPHRERGLDTAPAPDWSVIDQRIAAALAQQTKRVAALEERIALLDECSHQLAQAVRRHVRHNRQST
jgi:hypothetical protein